MTDKWVGTVKDWTDGNALPASDLDQELRDRFTAINTLLTTGASSSLANGGADFYHAHSNGTLASRPSTNLHAGMRYYATDLGAEFIYSGSRWDVIGVNSRIAEYFWDEFILTKAGTSWTGPGTSEIAGWWAGSSGSGGLQSNLSPGASELRLSTAVTSAISGSSVGLKSNPGGSHYIMDQASDRVPALYAARTALSNVNDLTTLFGLSDAIPTLSSTPNGMYFKASPGGAGGVWHCISKSSGGVITDTTTAVALDTSYHWFEIVIKSLTSVDYFIDGTLAITHTIPGANALLTTGLILDNYIINNVASDKRLKLDRIDWIAKR